MHRLAFALLSSIAFVTPAVPDGRDGQGRTVDLEAADCSRNHSIWTGYETAYAVRRLSVPAAGRLDVRPPSNGGARIERGGGREYSITACIAASGSTFAEAQQRADEVRFVVSGRRISADGPSSGNWNVQFVVQAPDNVDISVETSNGPIGIDGVSGRIDARAANGPIGIDDASGDITARAQNGPISVRGRRGRFDVETANGPISVELSGSRWDGRLDARAHNGPLSVRVPRGYQSGVEVSSSRHSPWNCRADACRDRDIDDGARIVRLGTGQTTVTISTVNGPVTINESNW